MKYIIIYAFQFPIPSHQRSITLICVKHDLFVSFSSSIAIDKRVRWIIIALNSPSRLSSLPQSVRFSYIHLFHNVKSYKRIYYHTINSFFLFHPINSFLPKCFSFLIIWWRHRMTLYKVSNLLIFFFYCFCFPIIILTFTTKVSIYTDIICIYNLNFCPTHLHTFCLLPWSPHRKWNI